MNKKFDFFNDNAEKFVPYFGLEYNEQWQVKKAFVVDKRIFAAYHTEYNIEFLLISELSNFINVQIRKKMKNFFYESKISH